MRLRPHLRIAHSAQPPFPLAPSQAFCAINLLSGGYSGVSVGGAPLMYERLGGETTSVQLGRTIPCSVAECSVGEYFGPWTFDFYFYFYFYVSGSRPPQECPHANPGSSEGGVGCIKRECGQSCIRWIGSRRKYTVGGCIRNQTLVQAPNRAD